MDALQSLIDTNRDLLQVAIVLNAAGHPLDVERIAGRVADLEAFHKELETDPYAGRTRPAPAAAPGGPSATPDAPAGRQAEDGAGPGPTGSDGAPRDESAPPSPPPTPPAAERPEVAPAAEG